MRYILAFLFLGLVVVILLRAGRKPSVFEIEFIEGRPRVKKGKVPHRFLQDCEELCRSLGIKRGAIRAVKDLEGLRLQFSPEIPQAYHQRFRNAWRVHASD